MKKSALAALFFSLSAGFSTQAHSLAMGPDEFVAARHLTCVLAQEALGYLSEDEYGAMTHDVLDGYDQAESDVIYAKALGYYDGLMFGLQADDELMINDRLQQYVESQSCRMYTGYTGVNLIL